jgi:predicted HTH domain antitoxin
MSNTKNELQTELDDRGIKYTQNETKQELLDKLGV